MRPKLNTSSVMSETGHLILRGPERGSQLRWKEEFILEAVTRR